MHLRPAARRFAGKPAPTKAPLRNAPGPILAGLCGHPIKEAEHLNALMFFELPSALSLDVAALRVCEQTPDCCARSRKPAWNAWRLLRNGARYFHTGRPLPGSTAFWAHSRLLGLHPRQARLNRPLNRVGGYRRAVEPGHAAGAANAQGGWASGLRSRRSARCPMCPAPGGRQEPPDARYGYRARSGWRHPEPGRAVGPPTPPCGG